MEQVAFLLLACVLSIVNSSDAAIDDPPLAEASCVESALSSVPEDNAACAAVAALADASACESLVTAASSPTEPVLACKYIPAEEPVVEVSFKDLAYVAVPYPPTPHPSRTHICLCARNASQRIESNGWP
jgi:hypothetical protein